jgi:hypothetical protein
MRASFVGLSFLVTVAACGGNVVVDPAPSSHGGTGGMGGSASVSSSAGIGGASASSAVVSSAVVSTSGTSAAASSSSSTGGLMCGSLLVSGDPTCQTCAEMNCCSQLKACDVGSPCWKLVDCILNCPMMDSACANACVQQGPAGTNDLQALSACLQQCPQSACSMQATTVCNTNLAAPTTSCNDCLTAFCCAEAQTCEADGLCTKCFVSNQPAGACDAAYASLSMCKAANCPKACP